MRVPVRAVVGALAVVLLVVGACARFRLGTGHPRRVRSQVWRPAAPARPEIGRRPRADVRPAAPPVVPAAPASGQAITHCQAWEQEIREAGGPEGGAGRPPLPRTRLSVFLWYQGTDEQTLRLGDSLARDLGGVIDRPEDRRWFMRQEQEQRIAWAATRREHLRCRLATLPTPAAVRATAVDVPTSSRVAPLQTHVSIAAGFLRVQLFSADRLLGLHRKELGDLEAGRCVAARFVITVPGWTAEQCTAAAARLGADPRFRSVGCVTSDPIPVVTSNLDRFRWVLEQPESSMLSWVIDPLRGECPPEGANGEDPWGDGRASAR